MTDAERSYQRKYREKNRERDRPARAARKKAYNAKRRASGVCLNCKAPSDGGSLCAVHREIASERCRRYRAANPAKYRGATNRWRAANKEKARDQQFRRFYGIGSADVDAMLAAQGGRCGICRTDTPDTKMRWHVDHCHASGKVRGILCHKCNMGIGALRDDPAILRSAVEYLETHK